MFCNNCGKDIADNAVACPACGASQVRGSMPAIPNHLVGAILTTIFCCLPFGIVSIVFASRANSAMGSGNYQLAEENANKAKTWFWWAFGCGIVSSVLWIILQVAAAAVSAAN